MTRFHGKCAIVTGGSSGIGLGVARRICEEGGSVVIWDLAPPPEPDITKFTDRIKFVSTDMTNFEAVSRAFENTISAFGHPQILVTCAGITGPNESVEDYPPKEWKNVIDVNLNGVFHANKAVVSSMVENNYGRIVNVASVAGKEGNPNAAAYSASKAGVIGLTKSLGKELAAYPICVNCVTPAAVRTPIFDQMKQEHIDFMLSKIPMARFGEIAEIVALICWLASEECSFSTGAVFDVSGGRATY